jgi:hypothetical protein
LEDKPRSRKRLERQVSVQKELSLHGSFDQ